MKRYFRTFSFSGWGAIEVTAESKEEAEKELDVLMEEVKPVNDQLLAGGSWEAKWDPIKERTT